MKVHRTNQAVGIHKAVVGLDLHIGCWGDVKEGRGAWVALGQPDDDWNVVLCALRSNVWLDM